MDTKPSLPPHLKTIEKLISFLIYEMDRGDTYQPVPLNAQEESYPVFSDDNLN
jgi:hypothetical protein